MDNEKMENMSIEETFECIETTLTRLKEEDISLEDSFALYKEGMELLKHCNDKIDRVEKEIKILTAEDLAD